MVVGEPTINRSAKQDDLSSRFFRSIPANLGDIVADDAAALIDGYLSSQRKCRTYASQLLDLLERASFEVLAILCADYVGS